MKGRGFESVLERRENFLLHGRLSVLTHFGIRSTPVLPQYHVKDPGNSAKSAGGRLQLNTHTPLCMYYYYYVALHEVTWSMVVWCTQDLRRDGCSFMWHQPCQRCKYTTSVDIKKTRYKASHSCRTSCERSESAQESGEQRYIGDHQIIKTLFFNRSGRASCLRASFSSMLLPQSYLYPSLFREGADSITKIRSSLFSGMTCS